jgi:hypothetical protein
VHLETTGLEEARPIRSACQRELVAGRKLHWSVATRFAAKIGKCRRCLRARGVSLRKHARDLVKIAGIAEMNVDLGADHLAS